MGRPNTSEIQESADSDDRHILSRLGKNADLKAKDMEQTVCQPFGTYTIPLKVSITIPKAVALGSYNHRRDIENKQKLTMQPKFT